jgi:uncharacterized protein RhaS with RHS repeats
MPLTREALVGSWRLVSSRRTAAGVTVLPWGMRPSGVITYTPEGRLHVLIQRGGRSRAQAGASTPAEKARLLDAFVAYAGTFTVDGDAVLHRIELASDPAMVGTTQVRRAATDGRRLTLTSAGGEPVWVNVWARIRH